jgi:hypothetical protein
MAATGGYETGKKVEKRDANDVRINSFFDVYDTGGGGDCLFSSLAFELNNRGINDNNGNPYNHISLRSKICKHNPVHLIDIVSVLGSESNMCDLGVYGTDTEIRKFVELFNIPVIVYQKHRLDGIASSMVCSGSEYLQHIKSGLVFKSLGKYLDNQLDKRILCMFLPSNDTAVSPIALYHLGNHYQVLILKQPVNFNNKLAEAEDEEIINKDKWICPICSIANDKLQNICYMCKTVKPFWACPHCTFENLNTKNICEACGTERSIGAAACEGGACKPGAVSKIWTCECEGENDYQNTMCVFCDKPKPKIYIYTSFDNDNLNLFLTTECKVISIKDFDPVNVKQTLNLVVLLQAHNLTKLNPPFCIIIETNSVTKDDIKILVTKEKLDLNVYKEKGGMVGRALNDMVGFIEQKFAFKSKKSVSQKKSASRKKSSSRKKSPSSKKKSASRKKSVSRKKSISRKKSVSRKKKM